MPGGGGCRSFELIGTLLFHTVINVDFNYQRESANCTGWVELSCGINSKTGQKIA